SWIILYPEGTFFDRIYPQVLANSRKYSQKLGREPFKNLLIPRSRALRVICKNFRHRFDAILDITVIYPNTRGPNGERFSSPSIVEYLAGVHNEVEIIMRYIEMKELPESDNDLEKWLYELYRHKDNLMTEYYSSDKSICEI
ncbi:unnamed protein product, partial [Medioppia subpectinata]